MLYFVCFPSNFDSRISLNFLSSSISMILLSVCMEEELVARSSPAVSATFSSLTVLLLLLLLLLLLVVVFVVVELDWNMRRSCCCWSIKLLTPLRVAM